MSYIEKMPMTDEEVKQKVSYIRAVQGENKLGNIWLIHNLAGEGFVIAEQTVSSALSMSLNSPKTREFLIRAERICREYEQNFPTRQQSGT